MKIIKIKQRADEEYVQDFLALQEQKNVSKETLDSHRYALDHLFKKDYSLTDIRDKLRECLPKSMNDSYFNKRLNTYRQFFDYLVKEEVVNENLAKEWKYRKRNVQIVNVQDEDVQRFLSAIKRDTFSSFRDYVFAMLILDSGLRPTEALRLFITDLDIPALEINIRAETTKTHRFRRVPVSPLTMRLLVKLISYRPEEWKQKFIFCTYSGGYLNPWSMQDRFRDIGKKAGVNISPYQLRHIFATSYIRNGGDAFTLQHILGHTTMEMTQVYVNLNINDIHEKHTKVSTLNNFLKKSIIKLK